MSRWCKCGECQADGGKAENCIYMEMGIQIKELNKQIEIYKNLLEEKENEHELQSRG